MNKSATLTWIILLLLTLVSAFISTFENTYVVLMVLMLSMFKFLGIAFQFMELKKGHLFWKTMIIGFMLLFDFVMLVKIYP